MMGLNLVDASGLLWQKNRRLMQRIENLISIKIEDKHRNLSLSSLTKVKSTFKFGRAKRTKI